MKTKQVLYAIILVLGLIWATNLHATDGTWTSLSSGNWNTPGNWSGGNVANGVGASAWFSTLNLTADVTVTLDINPSLGFLQFGDSTTADHNWILTGGDLILQASSGVPVIDVTNQTATINSVLFGSQGFNKSSGGTLILGGANTFSGGTLTNLAGYVQLNNANALAGLANVTVNSGATLTLGAGSATYANVPAFISGSGPSGFGRGAMYYNGNGGSATWAGPISVNGGIIGNYGAGGGYTFPNVISGSNGVTFWAGGGAVTHVLTVNLNTNETYTGNTTFNATYGSSEVVNLNATSNTLPPATALGINDNWNANYVTVNLAGHNQSLNTYTVSGGASATNNITSSSGQPTLTMTNSASGALALSGGTVNINNVVINATSGLHSTSADWAVAFGGPGGTATTVNINNNATLNCSFYTDLGRAANTVVNVNSGGALNNLVGGELLMAYGNGNSASTLNINSGGSVTTHYIRVGNNASATINLNTNGLLVTDQVYADNTNLFNFNGGVLRVNSSPSNPWFQSSLTNVYVQPGGATIDTAGHNAALASILRSTNGSGGLTKLGAGTLTLSAAGHTYTGSTVVSNGTLAVDGTLTTSAVLVQTPASGTVTVLSGTGTVATATVSLGGSVNPGRIGTPDTLNIDTLTCSSGSLLQFDLGDPSYVGSQVNDLLNVGSLTAGSPTYLSPNFLGGSPVAGRYVVATYSSASGLANLAVDPLWAGSRAAPGVDTSTLGEIALYVTNSTAPNAYLYWYGNNPNNNWDLAATPNWLYGSDSFYTGDSVLFDNSNAQTNVVNLVGALAPASVTFNNDSLPYTLTGSGKITGPASLTVNGTPAVILATDNDYSGPTTLNGATSTLQIGNTNMHGNVGSGDIVFTSTATAATLAYDRTDALTLNNRIAGGSGYQPNIAVDSGTLTLGGAVDNSYAVATVNGGTLVLGKTSSAAVHALGGATAALTVNTGGTAKLGGTGGDQIADARDVQLNGGTFDLSGMNEKVNNLSGYGLVTNSGGAATLTCGATLNVNGGTMAVAAAGTTLNPTGAAIPNIWVQPSGTLTLLSGTIATANYVGVGGQLNVLGGLISSGLEIMPGFAGGGGPGTVTIAGGALSSWQYRISDTYAGTTYLQTNGVLYCAEMKQQGTTPGFLYFNGGTLSRGNLTARNGGVWVHDTANVLVQQGGGLIDSSNYVVSIPVAIAHDPALGGTDGGLTKLGSGTLALNGTNDYNGPTLVNAGTLQINGILGTNTLTVATNATLDGNGVVLGPVMVQAGGTLAPGASIGVLAISNSLTLNALSTNVFEINSTLGTNDQVRGLSSVTYGGTLIVANLGGTISAPISFKLFDASAYNAAPFASVQLPALGGVGLSWTNLLTQNGTIAVISGGSATPPQATGIGVLPDNNFSLTVTGAMGTAWSLHATNSVAAPRPWPVIQSGTITTSPFTVNDLTATNYPKRFYQFSAP